MATAKPDPETQSHQVPHIHLTIKAGEDINLERIRRLIEDTAQQTQVAVLNPPNGHTNWHPSLGPPMTLVNKDTDSGDLSFFTAPESVWRGLGMLHDAPTQESEEEE